MSGGGGVGRRGDGLGRPVEVVWGDFGTYTVLPSSRTRTCVAACVPQPDVCKVRG